MWPPHCRSLYAAIACAFAAGLAWAEAPPPEEYRPDLDSTRAPLHARREYGDAPAPYGDAWHERQMYEWLGAGFSVEGAPRTPDLDTYDDGVSWDVTQVYPGNTFDLTVLVTAEGTNEVGYWTEDLRVWADWNQDGDFTDDGEMIVDDLAHRAFTGENVWTYQVTVPDGAEKGETYIRARLDWHWGADNVVGATGGRTYGEVEDYRMAVTPELPTMVLLLWPLVGLVLRARRRWTGRPPQRPPR